MAHWLNIISAETGVLPTMEQAEILTSDARFVLVAGGEQAGKSVVASLFLLRKYFELPLARPPEPRVSLPKWSISAKRVASPSPALYWLVGATYGET